MGPPTIHFERKHSDMGSTNSPREKPDTSEPPRPLTPFERESLRRDMEESSEWMREELRRRRNQGEQQT